MTKLSYKERSNRRREREILLSARRLIQAGGASQLNLDDLAAAVGISKPTLYQHFKSKDDLLAHVFVDSLREFERYFCSLTGLSPLARLKDALRFMLVNRYFRDGLLTGFENDVFVSVLSARADVAAAKQSVIAAIAAVVEEGKARGELTPAVSGLLTSCLFLKLATLPSAALNCMNTPVVDHDALVELIDGTVTLFERAVVEAGSPPTKPD